jgi:hypothetical protein
VSFDDEAVAGAARNDPVGFVSSLPPEVILDELQRVPEIFISLKVGVDEGEPWDASSRPAPPTCCSFPAWPTRSPGAWQPTLERFADLPRERLAAKGSPPMTRSACLMSIRSVPTGARARWRRADSGHRRFYGSWMLRSPSGVVHPWDSR